MTRNDLLITGASFVSAFNQLTFSSNTVVTGNVIELNNTARLTLGTSITANSTTEVGAGSFSGPATFIFIPTAYTDGTYTIALEAVGDAQGITTLAEAQTAFSAVANPFTDTTYAFDTSTGLYAVTYNYEYLTAQSPMGAVTIASSDVLGTISTALSKSSAVGLADEIRFAVLPGNYSFLRLSIKSTGVTTGAALSVQCAKIIDAVI